MSSIEATDVVKEYGDVSALDGLSLRVDGGIVGLLGTNGAGKTTLFKLLIGLDSPDSGHVEVVGRSPRAGTAVRERVGYLPESASFPPSLTGREVLTFHARMRGVPEGRREQRVAQVLAVIGLDAAGDRAVRGYSNGMNRRLGLGTAIVADPDVLLLDEPTAGLDPRGIERFHGIIERLVDGRDLTVVFASHALAEVERLCDRVAIVHDGTIVAQGSVADLRRQGTTPTVEATFGDSDVAIDVADRVRTNQDATRVTRTGSQISVDCESPYAVVQTLHEEAEPTRFEVREPGLEAAFESALGGERT
ncbi:MAG: Cu-processing system ATP-binding protein [Haloarculaceae archaeon]|jgi:Cu-processing system ATP-binding protein